MKKQMKRFFVCSMMMLIVISFSSCTSSKNDNRNNGSGSKDKTIVSVEISKMPYKTTYYVGEKASFEGGEIAVFYSNGSSEKLPMTDDIIKNEITTEHPGSINILIEYDKFSLTFPINVFDKNDIASQKFSSIASGFRTQNQPPQTYSFAPFEIVRPDGKTENWQSLKLVPSEYIMILWLSFDIVPKTDLAAKLYFDVNVVDYQLYPELSENKMSVFSQMVNFNQTTHIEIYFNAFEIMKNNEQNNSHIIFNFFDATKPQTMVRNTNSFAICNLKIVPWKITRN